RLMIQTISTMTLEHMLSAYKLRPNSREQNIPDESWNFIAPATSVTDSTSTPGRSSSHLFARARCRVDQARCVAIQIPRLITRIMRRQSTLDRVSVCMSAPDPKRSFKRCQSDGSMLPIGTSQWRRNAPTLRLCVREPLPGNNGLHGAGGLAHRRSK